MNVIVFGATGRTGKLVVQEALARGHQITAFARNPQALESARPNLLIVQGDILDSGSVARAVAGQAAVLCALGAPAHRPGTAVSEGTRNIVAAMKSSGVRRLVCLSAAGVVGDDAGLLIGRPFDPRAVGFLKLMRVDQGPLRASRVESVVSADMGAALPQF